MRRLKHENRQGRPLSSRAEEAFLNLQRTAAALNREFEEMLKPSGLTHTQYNVLRILRGAGPKGLLCRELGERMISRDPDITRLLDRLERLRLVVRARDSRDRRVIYTCITSAGLDLLAGLDAPVAAFHRKRLGHLRERDVQRFIDLLESARLPIR